MNQNAYDSIKNRTEKPGKYHSKPFNQSFSYFLKPAFPLKWHIIMQKIEFCGILRKRMQKLAIDKGEGQGLPTGKKDAQCF